MRCPRTAAFALLLSIWTLGPATPHASAQNCLWTAHPASPTVCVGATFSLSVGTAGAGSVSYQWFHNNIPVGGNSPTITVTNATLTDAGQYQCRVIRGGFPPCDQYSNVGTVTVNVPPMAQADSVAQLFCNNVNTPYRLRVVATSGTAPLSYRWHRNGTPIADGGRFSGTGTPELYCNQPFSGDTGGTWACQVTNSCGSVMITVPSPVQSGPPPFSQPLPPIIPAIFGQSFSLTGATSGLGVNSYQWWVNGVRLTNTGEPFNWYYGPLPNQATIWNNPLQAIHADAQIELRLINTCNDSNSSFTRLLTGNGGETEPNNDKNSASLFTMQAGYQVVGSAGSADTNDWYRLDSPATGAAIHRRTVQLESPDGSHQMFLKGLNQQFGVITNTTIDVQSSNGLDPIPSVRYYTCGQSPQSIYLAVRGTAANSQPYRITFLDEPQPTTALAGPPLEAHTPFTISVTGPANADSDLWCTDANGNNISGFGNDESDPSNHLSLLTRTTGAPGDSMRVAFSIYDLANNQPSPPDDLDRLGNTVDSPGVTLTSSTSFGQVMTLTVTQNGIPRTAQAAITEPHQVLWFDLPVRDCSPGDLGSQGGITGPDNLLDNNDFIAFIDLFFNADTRADLGVQGGLLGHDGAFDNNDFIAFINLFFAGCS